MEQQTLVGRVLCHAEKVTKAGHYLELVDFLLYCHHQKISVQLFMNTESPMEKGKEAMVFLHDLLGRGSEVHPPVMGSDVVWNVLLTRADYRTTNVPWELNHWVPLLPADTSLTERFQKILAAEKIEKESLYKALEDDSRDDSAEVHQSLVHALTQVTEKAVHLKRLTARLHHTANLAPMPVMADGNCGAWSALELHKFTDGVPAQHLLDMDPMGSTILTKESNPIAWAKMLSLREEVGRMWREVTSDPTSPHSDQWLQVFKLLLVDAGGMPIAKVTDVMEPNPSDHVQNLASAMDAVNMDKLDKLGSSGSETLPPMPPPSQDPDDFEEREHLFGPPGPPESPEIPEEKPCGPDLITVKKELPDTEDNTDNVFKLFAQVHPPRSPRPSDVGDVEVKQEPASPTTPQARKRLEKMLEEHSPPVIKRARNSSRAGIVHDRLVSGPAVPLRSNLSDIMASKAMILGCQGDSDAQHMIVHGHFLLS